MTKVYDIPDTCWEVLDDTVKASVQWWSRASSSDPLAQREYPFLPLHVVYNLICDYQNQLDELRFKLWEIKNNG